MVGLIKYRFSRSYFFLQRALVLFHTLAVVSVQSNNPGAGFTLSMLRELVLKFNHVLKAKVGSASDLSVEVLMHHHF